MTKFKVGDRVKVVKEFGFKNWPLNHEFIIKEIEFDMGGIWLWGVSAGAGSGTVNSKYCELVFLSKPKEVNMHYHVLGNSIVLNYLGKTVVVNKEDKRYEPVLEAIRSGDLNSIPAIVEIERGFDGSGIELKDGILHADGKPIPPELNTRILQYKEMGIPYESLLKFWENLKLNPSFNSRQQLFSFLTHNGHPLTPDGCFIAYRGVRADFKDKHSGTFDNSVGSVCEIPRDQVDDNVNNTCSTGLHVACFDYAKGFGEQLVEVKVNPKDVVAVPTDYNGTKMRVCRFEVVALGEKPRTEPLYGYEKEEDEECEDSHYEDDEYDSDNF